MSQTDSDEWMDRALELSQQTILTKRRAEVQALREAGRPRREIADELGLSTSTVSEHYREIDRELKRARATVDLLGDYLCATQE